MIVQKIPGNRWTEIVLGLNVLKVKNGPVEEFCFIEEGVAEPHP